MSATRQPALRTRLTWFHVWLRLRSVHYSVICYYSLCSEYGKNSEYGNAKPHECVCLSPQCAHRKRTARGTLYRARWRPDGNRFRHYTRLRVSARCTRGRMAGQIDIGCWRTNSCCNSSAYSHQSRVASERERWLPGWQWQPISSRGWHLLAPRIIDKSPSRVPVFIL